MKESSLEPDGRLADRGSMKRIATLTCLAVLALAPTARAADPSCAAVFDRVRAQAADAAFEAYVGFAPVWLNGEGPHWMLVDTGANRSALDAGLAARLGLPQL